MFLEKVDKIIILLRLMSDNPKISADEMKNELELTNRTVQRYISDMKSRKIIDRLGLDKGGSWKVLL